MPVAVSHDRDPSRCWACQSRGRTKGIFCTNCWQKRHYNNGKLSKRIAKRTTVAMSGSAGASLGWSAWPAYDVTDELAVMTRALQVGSDELSTSSEKP